VWVVLCRHVRWMGLDEIDHVIVLVVRDLRGLSWRYSCMLLMHFSYS
jgi:hypothetical protein